MANIQAFDELNTTNRHSIPYEEYFKDMLLTEQQKKRRVNLALILEDYLMIFFEMIRSGLEYDLLDEIFIKQELTNNLYSLLADDYIQDEYELKKYIIKTVNTIYGSTIRNLNLDIGEIDFDDGGEDKEIEKKEKKKIMPEDTSYWLSEDRAKYIAENEANTVCNTAEYNEAQKSGKKYKIWMAYPDDRVRPTHQITNGSKIPIDALFTVGGARMLYPKDEVSEFSTASDYPDEVINCRCTVKYI